MQHYVCNVCLLGEKMKKIRTNISYILVALTMLVGLFHMPIDVKAAEPQFGTSTVTYTNGNDPSKEINVYFTNESGSRYSAQDNLVAQFGSNVNGEVQSVIINTETDANPMQAVAGSYSGQVYFSMICE